jgi:hypothetical protein
MYLRILVDNPFKFLLFASVVDDHNVPARSVVNNFNKRAFVVVNTTGDILSNSSTAWIETNKLDIEATRSSRTGILSGRNFLIRLARRTISSYSRSSILLTWMARTSLTLETYSPAPVRCPTWA